MSYTLAAAAKACAVNKSTILRAIASGKISGTKDAHGEWQIEPAELHRVYPPAAERKDAPQRYAAPDVAALAEAQMRTAGMAVEIGMLREQLTDARQDRDGWRDEASAWRDQAQASQRQLTDQRAPQPVTWWRWLRSTG